MPQLIKLRAEFDGDIFIFVRPHVINRAWSLGGGEFRVKVDGDNFIYKIAREDFLRLIGVETAMEEDHRAVYEYLYGPLNEHSKAN